jgi:ketosteroid isomerase-like protein/predicted enzyme related to lactoylglutathione lyase
MKSAAFGIAVFAAVLQGCTAPTGEESTSAHADFGPPLREQHESKYVTDSSIWGKIVFDRAELRPVSGDPQDIAALADLLETIYERWLDRDNDGLAALIAGDTMRLRQGRSTYGKDRVLARIAGESRGERPAGYDSSMQLTIRDVQVAVDGQSATALYRVDIRGGARWEYADLATVLQLFERTDGNWQVVAHAETLALGDSAAQPVPDDVPNRVTPIRFDFVYPVKDLERAIDFYAPLIGDPDSVTADRASFRMNDAFFELAAAPLDERIVIKRGQANGYGIVDVVSLDAIADRLTAASSPRETDCDGGRCLVAEDPSGNVIVWREMVSIPAGQHAPPTLTLQVADTQGLREHRSLTVMQAWMEADWEAVEKLLVDDAVWVDDALGIAVGRADIEASLRARWARLGAGASGLDADLIIDRLYRQPVADHELVVVEARVAFRGRPKSDVRTAAVQRWSPGGQLETMFMVRTRESRDRPVNGMDYTAYPVAGLGAAGRYYKTLFGSEPYRDNNWFGFWSTGSVFGLVGEYSGVDSYSPVPHRSNGYADLSIRSAEEVYEYLQQKGAAFPQVEGINNSVGIDEQPGYRQILAVDSEGNLINFSQYLEY